MGTWKPNQEERVKIGIDTFKNHPIEKSFNDYYSEVRRHVETCLKPLNELPGYKTQSINYKIIDADFNIKKDYKNEKGECIFVQFCETGHVVVVGAGHDYGMPTSNTFIGANIINELGNKWSNNAILIFITGLKFETDNNCEDCGSISTDHDLQYRNVIEMYIGEYLLKQGIPILDKYSHKNYKRTPDEWWDKIEEIFDDYNIKKLKV